MWNGRAGSAVLPLVTKAVRRSPNPPRTADVADTLGGQWIFPAAITHCEPMTVMERNP